jgi:hypothetical protein
MMKKMKQKQNIIVQPKLINFDEALADTKFHRPSPLEKGWGWG